jgi:hypothetical protein
VSRLSHDFVDSDVDTSDESINITSHNFLTGDKIQLTTTGTLPTGLSTGTDYYVIKVDADNLKLAASESDADDGTAIDITAASGGGTHTISGQEWTQNLQVAIADDAIFTTGDLGAVGTVYRWFHPVNRTSIDLEVLERIDDNTVIVEPSSEWNDSYTTNPRLYEAKNTITGLSHLNGETVSIVADGYVLASPNNDIADYDTVTVSSGSCDLPNDYKGAIVHVGLPITGDIETLDIDTVDQKPVLIESKTVNKVYVHTYRSRGLYVGNRFPSDDKLEGTDVTSANMVTLEGLNRYQVNYENENPITGNRYQQPQSIRHEITLPGDWDSNGRIAIRQVDPVHAEILSIMPDFEIEER